MKRLATITLLLICSNVMAALTELKDIHTSGITVFVDIKKPPKPDVEIVKMRHIINYQNKETTSSGLEYISRKELVEYNCEEEHYRVLASSMHTAPMGKGKVVGFTSDATQWQPVEDETLQEALWKVACNKKEVTHHE